MPPIVPRRGEVWLALLPGETKVRPALIASPDLRNERAAGVLILPITSNPRPSSTHVLLRAGVGGLDQDSIVRCENVTLLQKTAFVRGPLGPAIDASTMREIERALMIAFGIAR